MMNSIRQILLLASQLARSTLAVNSFNIPAWDLQWTGKVGENLTALSSPTYDSSNWHRVSSRSTVFGGLIESGLFNTEQLFFSTNLQNTVDYLPYYSPWLYRAEFTLDPSKGKHVFLQTNGITSKADIYLNGHEVADKKLQAGAYGGHTYEVTNFTSTDNALLIQAYPTQYDLDFGLGWVDWNPYPPDNGTGVWRNVSIKQTGSIAMGPVRIVNDWLPGSKSANVMLKADLTNLEEEVVSGEMQGVISGQNAGGMKSSVKFSLAPKETKTMFVTSTLDDPQIWWPRQWGDQPLYTAQVNVLSGDELSDESPPTAFGIRHVTSSLVGHNYTMFTVNGHPFQVRGGGYAPDLFLRWNATQFELQAQYTLDMGLNTIRLEGKEDQPELFEIADRMGLMVLPGWECCDKWEAWSYNNEVTTSPLWNEDDYATANATMQHEAAMLQTHPSILGFLIGSDYWPDNRAAAIYVDALRTADWPNPIIASAAERGWPEILGISGMKMHGPYDWVPPNYWYFESKGCAFGFGSELGAGVGTPELGSLKQFLTEEEMNKIWQKPDDDLYHQNHNHSPFHNRGIYNEALFHRYGKPTNLSDYLLKAQMMDYEATRAQFEAFQAKWNAPHPATGMIYWMLNNAWPGLHWQLFDYYLHPMGAYFGAKVGSRTEHVAYSYNEDSLYLINHSLNATGERHIAIELVDVNGKTLTQKILTAQTTPNTSRNITNVPGLDKIESLAFLRVVLSSNSTSGNDNEVLSRNTYWLSPNHDVLDWKRSNWYTTRVSTYAHFAPGLSQLKPANISIATASQGGGKTLTLTNHAEVPAFFIRLNLVDGQTGEDVVPVVWTDNYLTLFPGEKLEVGVDCLGNSMEGMAVQLSGWNVKDMNFNLS